MKDAHSQSRPADQEHPASANGPFLPGVLVLVSLSEPREKFWGAILALTPAGLSIRGIDLGSFDDSAAMVRAGEPFTPSAVFFPMHRVERIELDAAEGDIPSLRHRFALKAGCDPESLFAEPQSSAAGAEG